MSSGKQYGLQLPKKASQTMVQKHSAFGDDSNSDKSDGGGSDWLKKSFRRENTQSSQKKQNKIDIQRALEQDATVYQYDEIYDQIEHQKQSKTQKDTFSRKPRYIQKLMVAAEKRKVENERRIERQVQKEREAEGEEFKDKETFVTSAYKKKLEEFAKLDADQKKQDLLEEIGDVTKQHDISGFYRHLYQTTVANEDNSSTKPSLKEHQTNEETSKSKDNKKDKRHYRKRKDSESSTEKNKNLDNDISSSSSSSSSSDSDSDDKNSESETEDPKRMRSKEYASNSVQSSSGVVTEKKVQETVQNITSLTPTALPQNNMPVINIWEKRTVGPVFDAALKRYLERKQIKLTAVH